MRRNILPHTVRHHPSKPKGQACCTTWTAVFGVLIFISVALLLFVLQSDVHISSDPSKSIHLQEFVTSLHIPETVKSLENRVYELEASMIQGNSHAPASTDSLHEADQTPKADKPQTKPRKKFAYAITITKDGSFQDGAAVLAYSIMKHSHQAEYDISFIAFVHPNVTTSREPLRRLGYHVIEVPVPINASAIKFDFLREKINKNGCCGAAELIKLTSYRLLQYDRVIHLDADVVLLNPIDPLFELPYSLVYTTDPNMATFKKGIDKMPVQVCSTRASHDSCVGRSLTLSSVLFSCTGRLHHRPTICCRLPWHHSGRNDDGVPQISWLECFAHWMVLGWHDRAGHSAVLLPSFVCAESLVDCRSLCLQLDGRHTGLSSSVHLRPSQCSFHSVSEALGLLDAHARQPVVSRLAPDMVSVSPGSRNLLRAVDLADTAGRLHNHFSQECKGRFESQQWKRQEDRGIN